MWWKHWNTLSASHLVDVVQFHRQGPAMHVNELAKRANVPAHVIRYYTQICPARELRTTR